MSGRNPDNGRDRAPDTAAGGREQTPGQPYHHLPNETAHFVVCALVIVLVAFLMLSILGVLPWLSQ